MHPIALTALKDNYIWAIPNLENSTFICVDPGDATPVVAFAQANHLRLSHILITHHHPDHTHGIFDLISVFPDAVILGPKDPRIPCVHNPVRDEDIIHLDHYALRVLATPGHTQSHICYHEPTEHWLFCGDTLFSAGCGRIFEGTIEQLYHSLQVLRNLPALTKVYCGHEYTAQNLQFAQTIEPENHTVQTYLQYLKTHPLACTLPSTIALEKTINPFLRTTTAALHPFARLHAIDCEDSLAIFTQVRTLKDRFP